MKFGVQVASIVILAAIGFFALNSAASGGAYSPQITGGVTAKPVALLAGPPGLGTGEKTTVSMKVDSSRHYSPGEIRVKKGTTVRIEADASTFVGCMGTLVIGGYDIRKRITSGDNVVEFVADKPGTFPMSCTMGMGGGRLVVENDDGSVPASAQAALPVAGGSCGAGGGGCGCGG